jgi:hypothetical protein
MAWAADITAACLRCGTAQFRSDLETACNTFRTSLRTELITDASKTDGGAEVVAMEEAILDIAKMVSEMLADET